MGEKAQTPLPISLVFSLVSRQSRTSVVKQRLPLPFTPPQSWFLHPWGSGQWPTSPSHELPWYLKPLARGTPIFPCLCVSSHTISGPVPQGLFVLFTVVKKAGHQINFHSPVHQGRNGFGAFTVWFFCVGDRHQLVSKKTCGSHYNHYWYQCN